MFRPRERAFKKFKCPRPQCVKNVELLKHSKISKNSTFLTLCASVGNKKVFIIKAVANDDFIFWWLSRILSVSVTVCVELLIDRSALLSICRADKKLWIFVTELTVHKKAERWGHQNAFTSYQR